jgi:hypothetical protein
MKAAWNVKLLGFKDKNMINTRDNGGGNFKKITSLVFY